MKWFPLFSLHDFRFKQETEHAARILQKNMIIIPFFATSIWTYEKNKCVCESESQNVAI